MILCVENPRESTKTIRINKQDYEVTVYKITINNQLYFYTLATSNLKVKNKVILFIIVSKRIEYFKINLTKVQDLYTENYKTLPSE